MATINGARVDAIVEAFTAALPEGGATLGEFGASLAYLIGLALCDEDDGVVERFIATLNRTARRSITQARLSAAMDDENAGGAE